MKNLNSRQAMAAMLLAAASTSALMAPAAAQTMPVADTQAETRMTTAAAPVSAGKPALAQAGVAGTVDAKGDAGSAATPQMTRDNGAPIGENRHSKAAGDFGPVLLEDTTLIEKLARFDREREPERVVHARGTGAHGVFTATADISNITSASLFASGKQTPVFVRFSTVIHPSGSPEGMRDPRGFATKFYTDQGNWDLVGNNLPIFFIRDAIQFPDMIHSLKPSPVTNKQDPNRFFDFFSATPEATNMLAHVYSNLGTPASYRTMDGNGVHAFKLVNAKGETVFAKFRWISRQGVKNLNGAQVATASWNYLTDDLYGEIAKGDFPVWDLMVQTMKPSEFAKLDYNPFDDTKEWLGVPFRKIGEMTLNKVPTNFFEFTEQSAFAPANMVPGIEASPDRMLQGRLFSYSDTQRHRIGANVMQLPVNRPLASVVNNNQDGQLDHATRTSDVNYFPAATAAKSTDARYRASTYAVDAMVDAKPIAKTNNFAQAGAFYRALSAQDRADLVTNLAGDLNVVTSARTKTIMVSYFYQADQDFGTRLATAVNVPMADVSRAVADYRAANPAQTTRR
ncbi:catalase [Sphingomonas aurantiaca]|uniref:Catalase n=2 Tax=Sphingomonas aurantiaca TaxID=185949 RepID=A0A2T5GIW3_9SPHN|nr:catalase [Sphingomonas aurantiaca]PTQ59252.1 catalase [Sphingomonas aurantiaca]